MSTGLLMKKRDDSGADSDADAFARAMAGRERRAAVAPLALAGCRRRRPSACRRSRYSPAPRAPHRTRMRSPAEDSQAPGVDRRELRKLKRGDYPPSDRHDLHGMTAKEAAASVQRFIAASRGNRRRCVCIVHGRGLRSTGRRLGAEDSRAGAALGEFRGARLRRRAAF